MNDKDFEFIEKNWKIVPMPALAQKYAMTPIELMATLRQKGIVTEIQPFELEFINDNMDKMPASEIQSKLSLTTTQFSQIVEKTLGKKRRKSGEEVSMAEAMAKTRWLIDEKLKLTVDDFLPREISYKHFTDNDLYNCIKFADTEKKKDFLYRHFTAVAFLVCHAYPQTFRPFQFRHAKENEYFKGPGGRKNLINAARWVIEKKMGFKPESLAIISKNRYFLRSSDLQFYGVGSHWFRVHFGSRDEYIDAILKEYQVVVVNTRENTKNLREALLTKGRTAENCEIPGCYFDDEYGIDIHHIIPVSASKLVRLDINAPDNLICLCPNHHRIAGNFNWKNIDLIKTDCFISEITNFIIDNENNPNNGINRDTK